MTELTPKLEKRLAALRAAGGIVDWLDAPKQHRRLLDLGLVAEGQCGDKHYAVLSELAEETKEGPING